MTSAAPIPRFLRWPTSPTAGESDMAATGWSAPARRLCRTVSIGRMEILVVEDEAAIADFVARGLEAEGYAVHTAADGIEGERLALEGAPDLVILDRMLPGRDGIEVLGSIRKVKPG